MVLRRLIETTRLIGAPVFGASTQSFIYVNFVLHVFERSSKTYCGESMKRTLSARETEILMLIVDGQSNGAIAETLGISVRTVEGHRARMMLKLGSEGVADIVQTYRSA
jgi:DNA-binding CsgD family transcriptional regulator